MTTPPNPDTELRQQIHMAMLQKSESAKDLGELTVVPLGFAVDVALQLITARDAANIGELEELKYTEDQGMDAEMQSYNNGIQDAIRIMKGEK